jgi:hypothetical protein
MPVPVDQPVRDPDIERLAMEAVAAHERARGREVVDVSAENRGWDLESIGPAHEILFIEVKGRRADADTVTVTRNEWISALNRRGSFALAVVQVDNGLAQEPLFFTDPIHGDPQFGVASVTLDLAKLRSPAR